MRHLLGIDIGGTKCAVVLARATNDAEDVTILGKSTFPTADYEAWPDAINALFSAAHTLLDEHAAHKSLAGIGIACGGPLDSQTGEILSPPNLPGWDRVPIVRLFQSRFHVPTRLENDANAGALAEWRFGAGKGTRNMVFLTFGTGLGAGMILNGALYSGASGMAGEIGHVRLTKGGPTGYNKKGSVEGYCSGGGLAQMARMEVEAALKRDEDPGVLGQLNPGAITAQIIARAAERGDTLALRILATSGRYLGQALAILIDVLNPERIVIGSIYARAEQFIAPAAQRVIEREALEQSRAVCEVVPAELGEATGDYAALSVAVSAFEEGQHDK